MFKCIELYGNFLIHLKFHLISKSLLVQLMAWRQTGNLPSFEATSMNIHDAKWDTMI